MEASNNNFMFTTPGRTDEEKEERLKQNRRRNGTKFNPNISIKHATENTEIQQKRFKELD